MLPAIASLLLGTGACLGLGLGTARVVLRCGPGTLTFGDAGLIGLVVLAGIGTAANFVVPVAPWAAVPALALGIILLVAELRRPPADQAWRGGEASTAAVFFVLVLAFLLPSVLRSSAWHFDTGLYHLQHIRLVMDVPVLLGAANIHERFGYNSAWFPAAAMLAGGTPGIAGAFVINALLAGFVLAAVMERVASQARRGGIPAAVFGVLVLVLVLATPAFSLRAWIGSPNTDLPASLLALYAFHLALDLSDAPGEEGLATGWMLVLCVAFALTVKLSGLPLLLLLALPILAWRRGQVRGRAIMAMSSMALVLGLPWLARGVATSGCLAYPQPSTCLPLPWTVHPAVAQGDMDWMRAWARLPATPPEVVFADHAWLKPWFQTLLADPFMPYLVALGLCLCGCIALSWAWPGCAGAWRRLDARQRLDARLIVGSALAALVFWFVSAPLIRYGKTFIFIPVMLAIAYSAPSTPLVRLGASMPSAPTRRQTFAALLAVTLVYTAVRPARVMPDGLYTFPVLPEVPVREVGVMEGLSIYHPREGEQCWEAARVCTPRLHNAIAVSRHGPLWMVRHRAE